MRVPTRTRVNPPVGSQRLSTFSVRRSSAADAGGRALARLGETVQQGVTKLGAHLKLQRDKDERFKAQIELANFTREQAIAQQEEQNRSPVGDTNFSDRADARYAIAEDKFLRDRIPNHLQAEIKLRSTQTRQGLNTAALKHQFESTQTFYENSVQNELSTLQLQVQQDPAFLAEAQDKLTQTIAETGLPGLRKAKIGNAAEIALAGVVYKQEIKEMLVDGTGRGPGKNITGNVADSISAAAQRHGVDENTLKTIAWLESKGNPLADNPRSSAGGLFQFIDTTAREFGLEDKYDVDQSSDAAARLLARNRAQLVEALGREPSPGELYLAHQQGAKGAERLLKNPNVLAAGLVGVEAVVLNGGTPNMTAGDFAKIWINKAEPIVDEADPRFDRIPFEQREKMRASAEVDARRDIAQNDRAINISRKSAHDGAINGIVDGTVTTTAQLDALHENHGFTGEQRSRQRSFLESFQKDERGAALIESLIKNPNAVYNVADDAADYNRWFSKLGSLDADAVTELANAVNRTGDIPTDAVGLLKGLTRSTNPEQALVGFQIMERLQAESPEGFEARVKGDLRDRYDQYTAAKSITSNGPELVQFAQGDPDLLQSQGNQLLDKEATELLKEIDIPHEFADSVQGAFTFFEGGSGQIASVRPRLQRAGAKAFIENYRITGNKDQATAFMLTKLQREWGMTFQGDQGAIISHLPLEKVYPAAPGTGDIV